MYYYSFLGHLWDIFMSHKLRDIFGTLLGLIRRISRAKKPQEFNKIIHRKFTGSKGCVLSFNQVHPDIMEANS